MALQAYLCVSVALFAIGLCCMIARRNLIHVLIGIELILNAAILNLVAFARFTPDGGDGIDGRVFAVFVIVIAVAEAAVGIAIIQQVVRTFRTQKPSAIDRLRE
ncbi:MAG TPA: NADH-quinone oxidoreductase subunit NuoK [Planctomycetota bacterium]|nr:NADH-quinone oxidoreductase subunit NuoK [Planctomycetota bacterium]